MPKTSKAFGSKRKALKMNNNIEIIKKSNKMKFEKISSKRIMALIIGISLLLMAAIAVFAVPAVTDGFVLDNASLTALHVTTNFGKYLWGVVGWIAILILDVLVSIAVYRYYNKDNDMEAAITIGLRLAYSIFLAVAIAHLLKISILTPASGIYNALNMFNKIWSWALIVFGLHLITLGILYNNEGGKKYIHFTIKSLLIIAGLGYMIINVGMLLVTNPIGFAAALQPLFLIPMIFGETFFGLWMLFRGGTRNEQ